MKEKIKSMLLVLLVILAALVGVVALKFYFKRVDEVSREILNKTEIVYETKNSEMKNNGFYVANFKSDLEEFVKGRNLTSITYEFEGENFYFDVIVKKNGEDGYSFEVERIANSELNINARMNLRDVESVEYRTDPISNSTVLKINEAYNSEYFAMTNGTYYFLGQDIESISFMNEHFYYVTYNPNYRTLEDETSCSREVRAKIDGFNTNDYYYKYGRINFLSDYYQKLATKTYTVQNKCDDLESKKGND